MNFIEHLNPIIPRWLKELRMKKWWNWYIYILKLREKQSYLNM